MSLLTQRQRESETKHKELFREKEGRAVCQRWWGAVSFLVVSDSARTKPRLVFFITLGLELSDTKVYKP